MSTGHLSTKEVSCVLCFNPSQKPLFLTDFCPRSQVSLSLVLHQGTIITVQMHKARECVWWSPVITNTLKLNTCIPYYDWILLRVKVKMHYVNQHPPYPREFSRRYYCRKTLMKKLKMYQCPNIILISLKYQIPKNGVLLHDIRNFWHVEVKKPWTECNKNKLFVLKPLYSLPGVIFSTIAMCSHKHASNRIGFFKIHL